jgi:hypothetical protein
MEQKCSTCTCILSITNGVATHASSFHGSLGLLVSYNQNLYGSTLSVSLKVFSFLNIGLTSLKLS